MLGGKFLPACPTFLTVSDADGRCDDDRRFVDHEYGLWKEPKDVYHNDSDWNGGQ